MTIWIVSEFFENSPMGHDPVAVYSTKEAAQAHIDYVKDSSFWEAFHVDDPITGAAFTSSGYVWKP